MTQVLGHILPIQQSAIKHQPSLYSQNSVPDKTFLAAIQKVYRLQLQYSTILLQLDLTCHSSSFSISSI